MESPVYDNDYYIVLRDEEPHVIEGEPMNWLIVNKLHNTIEGSVGPLPHAMALADQLNVIMVQRNKPSEGEELQ